MNLYPKSEAARALDLEMERGYQLHYLKCVEASKIRLPPYLSDLQRYGYEVCQVYDAMDAKALADRIAALGHSLQPIDLGIESCGNLLRVIFESEAGDLIRKHFLTEFAVLFMSLFSVDATDGLYESAAWHCDGAPLRHLKLLVYLNDDHDGATDVIDRGTSDLFKRIGYGFGPLKTRLDDLGVLSREYDIDFKVTRLRPKPGYAIIFEPTLVLHKGVYPTHGVRHLIQIGVIPWGKPWDTFLQENWSLFASNKNAYFPNLSLSKDALERMEEVMS